MRYKKANMGIKHHVASYDLGDRLLDPKERVVVGTRDDLEEPMRIAHHLGLSMDHPNSIIEHTDFSDGPYVPTFMTKKALDDSRYGRFAENYLNPDGSPKAGEGLKGKVVYIVNTFSSKYDAQSLNKRAEYIARTAKYNGAEAVVLVAYTMFESAQERGSHDTDHQRMQTWEAKLKYDGQAPLSETEIASFAFHGVDFIINPHNHSPLDVDRHVININDELEPMYRRQVKANLNTRYKINFVHVDLAPVVGLYVSDYAESHLGFDLSNNGENVLFLAPDLGIEDFVKRVREQSGLTNSAFAAMHKEKDEKLEIKVVRSS